MTYLIGKDSLSITCTKCGKTSYNLNDVANLYCGYCKEFHHGMDLRSDRSLTEREDLLRTLEAWGTKAIGEPNNMLVGALLLRAHRYIAQRPVELPKSQLKRLTHAPDPAAAIEAAKKDRA